MVDISGSIKKTSYFKKDVQKFSKCTKLIARGSKYSSSNAYANASGNLVNTGNYTSFDIVGISAEGKRSGRLQPDWNEILLAINSNVKAFVTDSEFDRNRSYNIGEREVANFLMKNGYIDENKNGWWTLNNKKNILSYI